MQKLGEYDFDVKHQKESEHGNADALSRHACAKQSCNYCEKTKVKVYTQQNVTNDFEQPEFTMLQQFRKIQSQILKYNTPWLKGIKRFSIPPEDLAFVLTFVRSPDNTCRSTHRSEFKSWISDLFDQKQQSVMWPKDGQSHLYRKYTTERKNAGRKPMW
mgnify:CR=1 FL=1